MDWQLSLVLAAVVFGAFVLYKFRPAIGDRAKKPGRAELKEARDRLEKATTDAEKAAALADAGDACARTVGLGDAAASYYLRAMRVEPKSESLVDRAAHGLARRPRILETLLWRRLGAEPWMGDHRDATRAALRHLHAIYTKSRRSMMRAKMVERALEAIDETARSEAK